MNEFERDKREQIKMDAAEETALREDIDYAYEQLGLDSIATSIEELGVKLDELGYDVSNQEILKRLGEVL